MTEPARKPFEITGRVVLLTMVGFFAVVTAVDSIMIYLAVSTFGGLDEADGYRKGLKYNQRIEAEAIQSKLGWTDKIAVSESGDKLVVTITSHDATPVEGLSVTAKVERPATNIYDRTLTLQDVGGGRYETSIADLLKGGWTVDVKARTTKNPDAAVVYQSRARVWKQS